GAQPQKITDAEEDKINKPPGASWPRWEPKFDQSSYVHIGTTDNTKRSNTQVLAIKENPSDTRFIQLDYIRSLVWVHDVPNKTSTLRVFDGGGGGGAAGGPMGPGVGPIGMPK